jgi:hypothetical protein
MRLGKGKARKAHEAGCKPKPGPDREITHHDTLVIFMSGQALHLTPCGASQSIYGSIEK